ncbi:MAG: glycosyltransferase family 4 protein [Acidobacteriota bacterium]
MRILHLTAFVHGAAGQAAAELAIGQKRVGHHVTMVTSRTAMHGHMNQPELLARLAAGGVAVHEIDSLAARQTMPNADVVQFVHEQLGSAAAFDVLHTHGTVPSVIAIAAARKVTARVPIVQTTHEWSVTRPTTGRQSYDLEVMNLVDRAVVPTWSVADHFANRGVVRRQIAVVPYGVYHEPTQMATDALEDEMRDWRERGGVVLCYVMAPGSSHDMRVLKNALPHVSPSLRVLCVVFGVAPDAPVPPLAVSDGPVHLRFAPVEAAVRHYLHDTDFLVLPAGDGEQPLAVLEAFCDQVPVFASRVPELTEFIDDGQTGWLFDPTEPKGLAETLALARSLAPHQVRALCQRARVLYQSEFTVDRMVSGYMREYARLA